MFTFPVLFDISPAYITLGFLPIPFFVIPAPIVVVDDYVTMLMNTFESVKHI